MLCLVVHTPMGSNIERYGVLLAGPLLLCARRRRTGALAEAAASSLAAALALCVAAVWVAWGPGARDARGRGKRIDRGLLLRPRRALPGRACRRPPAGPVRVEVPLTRSHWEAALLAPTVSLARGWEKQLDTRFDGVLLAPGLTASAYERWLHRQAVAYVALPDTPLDPSSAQEGRLIRGGLPFLREVFASRHWTRVQGARSPRHCCPGPGG